jgi:hypothetical protein
MQREVNRIISEVALAMMAFLLDKGNRENGMKTNMFIETPSN